MEPWINTITLLVYLKQLLVRSNQIKFKWMKIQIQMIKPQWQKAKLDHLITKPRRKRKLSLSKSFDMLSFVMIRSDQAKMQDNLPRSEIKWKPWSHIWRWWITKGIGWPSGMSRKFFCLKKWIIQTRLN